MKLKILILSIITCLFLLTGVGTTYAYSIQPDGNLKSDNLINLNSFTQSSYLNYSTGEIVSDSDYYWTSPLIYVETGTNDFSFSCSQKYINDYPDLEMSFCAYDLFQKFIGGHYFNYNSNKTSFSFTAGVRFIRIMLCFDDITQGLGFEFMLNEGFNEYLPYEPYGLFYSQSNYNTLQDKYDKLAQDNVLLQNAYQGLLDELNIYNNYVIYGWGTFIDSLFVYDLITDTNVKLTFQQLIDGKYLVNNVLDIPKLLNEIQSDPNHRFRLTFTFNENFSSKYWYLNSASSTGLNLSCVLISASGKEYSFKISYFPNEVILGSNYDSIKNIITDNITLLTITGDGVENSSSISLGNNDSISFSSGYSNGYQVGYEKGSTDGYEKGYDVGNIEGYNKGVEQDFASSGFSSLLQSILSFPVNLVKNSLNFEFMGINIASLIMFIISISIVAFVIKRFK